MNGLRICLVCVTVLLPVTARAQAAPDTITQLLVEVRALRIAMERAATVGARIQLLVARVQLQEQRIAELSRRMTTLRDQVDKADTDASQVAIEMKRVEGIFGSNDLPPAERPHFERMLEGHKTQLALIEKRRRELVNEEALLAQQLAADQGRWSDINNQLEELERTLAVKQ